MCYWLVQQNPYERFVPEPHSSWSKKEFTLHSSDKYELRHEKKQQIFAYAKTKAQI